MIVYKITNEVNGKVYIGITRQSLKSRWYNHCYKNSNCSLLRNAIEKYGKHSFIIEQIDTASSKDDLTLKEKYWIEFYKSTDKDFGYNLLSGGLYNFQHSDTTKQKMSKTRAGKVMTDRTREALLKANTGRKMSDNVRKALSEANKNKTLKLETRLKLSNLGKKRKLTEEHKKALQQGSIRFKENKLLKQQATEKMRKSLTGKKRTVESRLKQSKTLKNKPLPDYAKKALERTREYIESRGWKNGFKKAKKNLIQELITILEKQKGNICQKK